MPSDSLLPGLQSKCGLSEALRAKTGEREEPMTMIISRERGFSSTDFGRSFGGAPPESRIVSFALPPAEPYASGGLRSETMVLKEAIAAQRKIQVRAQRTWHVVRRWSRIAETAIDRAWRWSTVQAKAGWKELRRNLSSSMERDDAVTEPIGRPLRRR
jgi:hypothetical protein